MGSTTFNQISRITDPQEAFRISRQEAAHEFGAGGYSGSLAEKHSFVIVNHKPLPLALAQDLAAQISTDPEHPDYNKISDKWGPAGAMAVDLAQPTIRRVELEIEVTGGGSLSARDVAEENLTLLPNEYIFSARILEDQTSSKPLIRDNQGAEQTVYIVTRPNHLSPATGFQSSYPTLAEAKYALGKRLREPLRPWESPDDLQFEIIGVLRRADGEPLAAGCLKVSTRTVRIEAELAAIPTSHSEDTGWLFFGWASC